MKKEIIILLLLVLVLPLVSGLSVNPSSLSLSANNGDILIKKIKFSAGVNETIDLTFSKSGDISSWIDFSPTSLSLTPSESKNLTVIIYVPSDTETGIYNGNILYDSVSIPISITVTNTQPSGGCDIIPFPTIHKRTIQQGATSQKLISVLVSKECTGPVSFRDVDLEGDIIDTDEGTKPLRIGDVDLGNVEPLDELRFNVILDAKGVEKGTYNALLRIYALDSDGNPLNDAVSFIITVAGGISPGNSSFANLPTCSVSSLDMARGQYYKLICTGVGPNLEVVPIVDNEFIKGVIVEEPQDQYIWTFTPKQLGTTSICADFKYKNAPIGDRFCQDVRIIAGGTPTAGTKLGINFYQSNKLVSKDQLLPGKVDLEAVDESTKNRIETAKFFLGGKELNVSSFLVQSNVFYILRASALGYMDAILNFTAIPKAISLSISPTQPQEGNQVFVTTNPVEANLFLNGNAVSHNFTVDFGFYTLKATYEGYLEVELNFTAGKVLQILGDAIDVENPDNDKDKDGIPELKKGQSYTITFSKNASKISIFYSKDPTSPDSKIEELYVVENANSIPFIPQKVGQYWVEAEGKYFAPNYEVRGFTFPIWAIIAIILVVLIVLTFLFIRASPTGKPSEKPGEESGQFQF